MRRNIDISAHSSIGDGSVTPHGVVISTVVEKLSTDGIQCSERTHALNLASHVRPLFADHAIPAAFAATVSVSSHLLRAVQTCVRVVSVLTSRPRRSSESSLPGGGVGNSGPSIPHSSSMFGVSSCVQETQTNKRLSQAVRMAGATKHAPCPHAHVGCRAVTVMFPGRRQLEWSGHET